MMSEWGLLLIFKSAYTPYMDGCRRLDSGCLFIVSKNYKYFYSLLPCFLIILYLYPVCYFISNRQPAVIASDDQPVAAFLNNLDGAAFFDVHVSHSFKDFRNTEHPFYGAGIACVCLW